VRLRSVGALALRAAPVHLVAYVLLVIASAAAPVAGAWLTRGVVDRLASGAPGTAVLNSAVLLAATGALLGVTPHLVSYLRQELDRRAGRAAQRRLLEAVDRLSGLQKFEDPEYLDRLRMAQQTGDLTCGEAVAGALGMLRSAITIAGFVVSLLLLGPWAAAFLLAGGVPTVLAELGLARRRAKMYWRIGPVQRREMFYTHLLTTVGVAKELRLFGANRFLHGRIIADRVTADTERRRLDRLHAVVQTALAVLAATAAGAGLLWAVSQARAGRLSPGDVVVVVTAIAGLQAALSTLADDGARVHFALQTFGHYQTVVGAGPDLPAGTKIPRPLRHGIELRDVWFRYSDDHPWALRGVNLFIPRGTAVALVGRNGSGKSTLVKLLCRFYDPTRGAVLWDATDVREFDVAALRRHIGAVFQDHVAYDFTAAENIALADVDDLTAVRAAAAAAGVDTTVERLPRGYDTLLSRIFAAGEEDHPEAGVILSGGQWQRLALARALYHAGRDLMLLDEPSSGLDAEAEHEVHSTLLDAAEGSTCLLVSHRLGAVRHADHVVVLDAGTVAERGDHASLIAAGGEYARLFALQADGYRAEV
jgi:ATP-binding cassette subfamily B protein